MFRILVFFGDLSKVANPLSLPKADGFLKTQNFGAKT